MLLEDLGVVIINDGLLDELKQRHPYT